VPFPCLTFLPLRFNAKDWYAKYFNQKTFEGLNIVRAACDASKMSMGEASLRWLMHHSALGKGDAVVLGGSSLKQFKDNIAWCDKGPLSKDIVDAFDSAYA
jgi:aflatoxin B1 aldehyde reductase